MSREMKDSGVEWIGKIPKDWKVIKNKNCFELEKNIVGSSFENYQLLSLTKKGIVKKDFNDVSGKIPDSYSTYQSVRKNQLVLCLFDLDCSAVFSGLSKFDGMISPAYKIYNCKSNIYEGFARYWFDFCFDGRKYKYFSKSLRYVVNTEDFGTVEIALPNILEQKKLANFLDEKVEEIDRLIDNAKKSIEEYKQYKQSVITEAVTKGLDPNVEMKNSKNSYIGQIPKYWNEKRLKFLGYCQNGISKSSGYFGTGYPFISYSDVYKNYVLPQCGSGLIESSEIERGIYSVKYGDVFFTRTSETIEEVGFVSTCLKTIENATFTGFVIRFRPNNQKELLTNFSKYYFRSDIHRKFFVKEMNLVTRASLSQELLKKLPVLLPPLEEQEKIAIYLDEKCFEIDNLIIKKQKLIANLELYKKSLIYECVTGKKEI